MKILGIGVDIIHNKRINKSIKNKTFINRTFSINEIIKSKKILNKTNYFAKRFAAKESFVKAVGSGFRDGINFKDIEISNNKLGKPYYIINKNLDIAIYQHDCSLIADIWYQTLIYIRLAQSVYKLSH